MGVRPAKLRAQAMHDQAIENAWAWLNESDDNLNAAYTMVNELSMEQLAELAALKGNAMLILQNLAAIGFYTVLLQKDR